MHNKILVYMFIVRLFKEEINVMENNKSYKLIQENTLEVRDYWILYFENLSYYWRKLTQKANNKKNDGKIM